MDWFTGVVIPIAGVILGGFLTIRFNRNEAERNESIQTIKLLRLMEKEIQMTVSCINNGEGTYFSRKFYSGIMVLNSSCFSIDKHEQLLHLTFQMVNEHDKLDNALTAIPTMISPVIGGVSTPTITNRIMYSVEKFLNGKSSIDELMEMYNNVTKKIIKDSTDNILKLSSELLPEVHAILKSQASKRSFLQIAQNLVRNK